MEEEKSQKMAVSERKERKRGGENGKVKNIQKMQILFYAASDFDHIIYYTKKDREEKKES
jgi:hypothetical protein